MTNQICFLFFGRNVCQLLSEVHGLGMRLILPASFSFPVFFFVVILRSSRHIGLSKKKCSFVRLPVAERNQCRVVVRRFILVAWQVSCVPQANVPNDSSLSLPAESSECFRRSAYGCKEKTPNLFFFYLTPWKTVKKKIPISASAKLCMSVTSALLPWHCWFSSLFLLLFEYSRPT